MLGMGLGRGLGGRVGEEEEEEVERGGGRKISRWRRSWSCDEHLQPSTFKRTARSTEEEREEGEGKLDGKACKVINMTKVPEDLVSFASELADTAGAIILQYWRASDLAVSEKDEAHRAIATSPLTEADLASERAMRDLINERYPDHGVYGEEFGEERVDAEFVWVLDPIDGTKSFMTGKPLFGT